MSKHVKDQISLYIDGMLKDVELKAFETHVKTCGECANALAGTKRAVNKAKNVREVPLSVNFYAKLNQKLDAADAEKGVFNWPAFMRSAAVVCTMLIVGVFVYNIKNQTNNFSDVRMKQDSQMPAEKPAGEAQGDYVMQQKIPDEVHKPAKMKKAAAPEGAAAKDKLAVDVDMKKVADDVGFALEATPASKKAEAMKVTEEKASMMKTRSVKAPVSAAKMMETSAGSGGVASISESDAAVPQPFEEAELKSMEDAGSKNGFAGTDAPANVQSDKNTESAVASDRWMQYEFTSGEIRYKMDIYIVRDETAWASVAGQYGIKTSTVINWTKQMAIVVADNGGRKTAGDRLAIASVLNNPDKIIVLYSRILWRDTDKTFGGTASTFVVLNKSSLPVEVRKAK